MTDRPVSIAGRKEFTKLSRQWSVADGARYVSSDLLRARESAALLTNEAVRVEARLREMNFGQWEDRTWEELEQQDGAALSAWMEHWTTIRPPGGESFDDMLVRVKSWLDEIAIDGTEHVVVAHAGSIRAAAVLLLHMPPAHAFSLAVDHGHISTFTLTSLGATLLRWNAICT